MMHDAHDEAGVAGPAGARTGPGRAEVAVEPSEDVLRLVAGASRDVILLGRRGHQEWVSPSVLEATGLTQQELLAMDEPLDLVHPEDREAIDQRRVRLRQGEDVEARVRVRSADGRWRWFDMRSRPIADEGGGFSGRNVSSWRPAHEQVALTQEVADQRERLRATLDSLIDQHALLRAVRDDGGRIVDFELDEVNDAVCQYLRRPRAELVGASLVGLMPGIVDTGLLAAFAEVVDTGRPLVLDDFEYAQELLGRTRRYYFRGAKVGDAMSFTVRDVTAQVEAAAALADSERLLRTVLDASRDVTVRFDRDGRVTYANQRTAELSGIPVADWLGRTLAEIGYDPAQVAEWDGHTQAAVQSGEPLTYEFQIERDGRWSSYEASLAPVLEADGRVSSVVMTARDVTERVLAEEELERLATRDALTGLANRAQMIEEIGHALAVDRRAGTSTAVLMMDLDRFKFVNDSLGHAVGDELIRGAARRLESIVRVGDLVVRPGGDEFVVVMRDLHDPAEALHVGWRIVEAFRAPFATIGADFYATASLGVAISVDGNDPHDLVREADTAMYVAKAEGGDRLAVFNEELRSAVRDRVRLESDLRSAIERGELEVWFQPEVDLTSGCVVAAEALLRWRRHDGEVWPAGRFIEVAEETGLIVGLGELILRRACEAAASWPESGAGVLTVRVNLSAHQLGDAGLLDGVDEVLAASGLDPARLCVEITESVFLQGTRTVLDNLAGLRSRGVTIASDDFGTGYASLSHLRDYPVDLVKIDRSFVGDVTDGASGRGLVAGIVSLSRSLGLAVTAEGVESEAQAASLVAMGCRTAQGFLFAPAVDLDEFHDLAVQRFPVPWSSVAVAPAT